MFAIQLAETSDSFLLGLPALLVNSESRVKGRAFVNQPYIRLFKANVLFVMNPEPIHKHYYYQYVLGNRESLKWYLDDLREAEIQTTIHSQVFVDDLVNTSTQTPQTTPVGSSPYSFTVNNISNERH